MTNEITDMRALATAILVATSLGLLVAGQTAGARAGEPGPKNGKIIYQVGNVSLRSIDPDGRHDVRFPPGGGRASDPAIAPDGETVLFIAELDISGVNEDLFEVPLAGAAPPTLIESPDGLKDDPSYSPDGTKIVYSGGPDLGIVHRDGSGTQVIAAELLPEAPDDPVFTPDGNSLVFSAEAEGQAKRTDLYSVNLDGTNLSNLTPGPQTTGEGDQIGFSDPVFSRDGKTLLCTGEYTNPVGGRGHIYAMKPSGAKRRKITRGGGFSGDPDFSPDGERIVFARSQTEGRSGLFIARTDGTRERRLVKYSLGAQNGFPVWAPR